MQQYECPDTLDLEWSQVVCIMKSGGLVHAAIWMSRHLTLGVVSSCLSKQMCVHANFSLIITPGVATLKCHENMSSFNKI